MGFNLYRVFECLSVIHSFHDNEINRFKSIQIRKILTHTLTKPINIHICIDAMETHRHAANK